MACVVTKKVTLIGVALICLVITKIPAKYSPYYGYTQAAKDPTINMFGYPIKPNPIGQPVIVDTG
jgi:hypothetical protein